MPLTDEAVKAAEPQAKSFKFANGGGLHLLVTPAAGKLWRLKYRLGGKEKHLHPDHDTIAAFRRSNKDAIAGAFLQVLLLAREVGLLQLGTVSIDGTKIDANASKRRSSRLQMAYNTRPRSRGTAHRQAHYCKDGCRLGGRPGSSSRVVGFGLETQL